MSKILFINHILSTRISILGSYLAKSIKDDEDESINSLDKREVENSTIYDDNKNNISNKESFSKSLKLRKKSVSTMDDLDAPQWADFEAASPQIVYDDYFVRRHDEHEYREKFDCVDSDSPHLSILKLNQNKQLLNENSCINKNTLFKTPIKVVQSKIKKNSSSKKNNAEETNCENVLMEETQKKGGHKYRENLDSLDSDSPNLSILKPNRIKSLLNESILQKTPIKVMPAKLSKNLSFNNSNAKETTYENVLMEAMNNLQLSSKKTANEKSFNVSCLIDSPAFITPSKRITRSMCTQIINTSKHDLEVSYYESAQEELDKDIECLNSEDNKKNISSEKCESITINKSTTDSQKHDSLIMEENNEEYESSINEQTSQIHLEVTASSIEHEISHEKSEESKSELHKEVESTQIKTSEQFPKGKVVTSFTSQESGTGSASKKKVTALTGNAWHRQVKRRMSIANKRLSLSKSSSNKFISMAEAVTKFQRSTPQRFRTINIMTTKTEQLRRVSFKLTRAVSPALTCKNRTRPTTAISADEKERLELEKIRQNQIKANPVPKDILKKPASLKKVEKKMITNPEPFKLTDFKKGQFFSKQSKENKRIHPKTVPLIVDADDKGVLVKNEEVLYYGIPCKTKLNSTKVKPFSFEARNKELQMKKQEKLKMIQEKEQQKLKAEFHARPVPIAVKTPIKPVQKENSLKKPKMTLARTSSFEERHKQVQKKKEEKVKQMLEEEKRARAFKAQKVPEFKPVMIRGRSKDNILKNSLENLAAKSHNICCNDKKSISLKGFQENLVSKQTNFIKKSTPISNVARKKASPSSISTENQENRNQGAVPKILEPKCKLSQKSVSILTELNTDKRAKQRKEFDEHVKKKEIEEKEMRKRDEEEKTAKEKAEKSELRKMTEIKARPMPVYKPVNIVKSNKPLTEPHSPAWSKRKGTIH